MDNEIHWSFLKDMTASMAGSRSDLAVRYRDGFVNNASFGSGYFDSLGKAKVFKMRIRIVVFSR